MIPLSEVKGIKKPKVSGSFSMELVSGKIVTLSTPSTVHLELWSRELKVHVESPKKKNSKTELSVASNSTAELKQNSSTMGNPKELGDSVEQDNWADFSQLETVQGNSNTDEPAEGWAKFDEVDWEAESRASESNCDLKSTMFQSSSSENIIQTPFGEVTVDSARPIQASTWSPFDGPEDSITPEVVSHKDSPWNPFDVSVVDDKHKASVVSKGWNPFE